MNAHPGTPTDIDFYISPRGGDGSLPPRHDWLRISESEGTATEVHLIGGSTNIQVFVDMTTTMLPSAIEWIGRDKFGFSLMYDVIRAIPTLLKFQMSRGRKKCGEGEGEGGGEGSSEGDLGEEMEEELDHSTSVAQASKPAISSYRAAGAG